MILRDSKHNTSREYERVKDNRIYGDGWIVSLCSKKTKPLRVWTAVGRWENDLIDFTLWDRSEKTGRRLRKKLTWIQTRQVYTDYWKAYESFIPFELHTQTKAETYTVEWYNGQIRHYLARFHRKTYCYSKQIYMVYFSLLLLMYAKIIITTFT